MSNPKDSLVGRFSRLGPSRGKGTGDCQTPTAAPRTGSAVLTAMVMFVHLSSAKPQDPSCSAGGRRLLNKCLLNKLNEQIQSWLKKSY